MMSVKGSGSCKISDAKMNSRASLSKDFMLHNTRLASGLHVINEEMPDTRCLMPDTRPCPPKLHAEADA